MRKIGFFGLILAFAMIWLLSSWWWIFVGLFLLTMVSIGKITWDVSEFAQRRIKQFEEN